MSCFRRYTIFRWCLSSKTREEEIEEYVNSRDDDDYDAEACIEKEEESECEVEETHAVDSPRNRYNLRLRKPISYCEN
jgi:hypothetical protein